MYHDWINPYWNYWLIDYSLRYPDYVALWVYHHRYEMDILRYEALLRELIWLQAKLLELETRGMIVDPNYYIPGIDEDLVYSRDYINGLFR